MDYSKRILQTYQKMLSENKLLTEEKLKECYETFRNFFSPEKLKSLDGEVLLDTMFNHGNRGSLVYWLEFKSDDEFPTNKFGGIAGGSSFKFGIFKRKDDGKWITGSSRDIKEVSVEEAVAIARGKRDLLIKGAEIIAAMPNNYDDSTYIKLQDDLDSNLGNFGDAAWVHKYFHMLFPDKISEYHAPDFQRFYLLKLLQKPIRDTGRYVLDGQYMRMARQLNMHIHYFTAALGEIFGTVHSYWRVGTTEGDLSFWGEMLKNGYVSIGWPDLGDLNSIDSSDEEAKRQIKELLKKYYSDPRTIGRIANQILSFAKYIKPDDIVVSAEGQTILGIGRVTGKYEYRKELKFPHLLNVEWLKVVKTKLPNAWEGLQTAVYQYKDFDNILAIEKLLSTTETTIIKEDEAVALNPLTGIVGQIEGVLQRKKQVILYGPPGTGKTYWAERACLELAAKKAFGKHYEKLNDSERLIIKGDGHANGLVRMCCFHPSYSYEDFIEGIKPSVVNNQTVFELRPGIFKNLCEDALKNPAYNYYLIIDEINRGDISRIFGELITIIEAGKRGKQMLLPLSGQVFSVPENVYIVATMNTADRSIALLDVALRRRFGFIELMPDYSLLEISIEGLPLGLWLKELNKRICENVGRDARNLQIGHSYFMENGRVIKEFDKLCKVIHEDVIPLLEEYCYGDYTSIAKIIGEGLVDTSNQVIRHDLFNIARKSELISALLATCPDITTSSKVQTDEQEMDVDEENDEAAGDAEV
jgi:5-methylcytosine-specific restriction protein B